jgi:hypothetical protein
MAVSARALKELGVERVYAKIFDVNVDFSKITNGLV